MINIVENFITSWLKDILVVFILVSLLEVILPKGKMRRFVNFIIGLLIILVIISPFTDLEKLQLNMDLYTEDFIAESDTHRVIAEQERKVIEVFTNRLNEEVRNLVESNSNYQVTDINITTRKEERDEISIQSIYLTIGNENNQSMNGIKIKPVELGEDDINQENDQIDLKSLISDYLGIDRNIVYISEVN